MSEAPPPLLATSPAETASAPRVFVCANCARENAGTFCTACGQKQLQPEDLSVRRAWHHILTEVFDYDGKVFTSLRLLFTRPGQLTLDFLEGRRARHVHPIRLFLAVAFLFFFFAQVNPTLDTRTFFAQIIQPKTRATLEARAARKGTTADAIIATATTRATDAFKTVNIGATLLAGGLFWLLFRGRRRYLAENMVMVLHLATFNMCLWLTLGWLVLFEPARMATSLVITVAVLGYFLLAARRVYGESWPLLVGKWLLVEIFKSIVILGTLTAIFLRGLAAS